MKRAIVMDPKDNVATALTALERGDDIEVISANREMVKKITAREALPLGHKIAFVPILKEGRVIKYGATIGRTTRDISAGEHVHIHNVKSDRFPLTEHMLGLTS
jgi:altronate dehydratase small subunit